MKLCTFLIAFALIKTVGACVDDPYDGSCFIVLPKKDYAPSANNSICISNNGILGLGAQDCIPYAEVVLVTRYMILGINEQGSLGTFSYVSTGHNFDEQLGMRVDTDKNGFISQNPSLPGYMGDIFYHGPPLEGFLIIPMPLFIFD